MVNGLKTPVEKAPALTYWVRRNVRYLSVGDKHDYTPHRPAKVLANRYGDCKDTSQLLAVMLRACDIKVELATLGSLDDGQVDKDVPSPWGSHAILLVTIDGKEHWIDTTVRLAAWDFVPRDDADRLCYITDEKGKIRLLRTPKTSPDQNRVEQTTDVWIGYDGSCRYRRTVVSHGTAAYTQRDSLAEVPSGERRRLVTAELQEANIKTQLRRLAVDEKALVDHDQPVTVKMEFEIPRHFTGSPELEGGFGDNRVWSRLLSHTIDQERKTPLVLPGPFSSIHRFRVHVPIPYELDGIPNSRTIKSKWGSFTISSRALDDSNASEKREVEVIFYTRLDNPRIEPADLDAFRRFHEEINREYRAWLTLKPVTQATSIPLLESLLAVSPQDALASRCLAKIYLVAGRNSDARRILQRACFYNPADNALWDSRLKAVEGSPEEEAVQREVLKRFPNEDGYVLALASTLITGGKHAEARTLVQGLMARCTGPDLARAHYQLARSHYRKDEPKQALAQLDAAVEADEAAVNTLKAWTLRGQVPRGTRTSRRGARGLRDGPGVGFRQPGHPPDAYSRVADRRQTAVRP